MEIEKAIEKIQARRDELEEIYGRMTPRDQIVLAHRHDELLRDLDEQLEQLQKFLK